MKLALKYKENLFLVGAVISWLSYIFVSLYREGIFVSQLSPTKELLFNALPLLLFFFYYYSFKPINEENFISLVYRLSFKAMIEAAIVAAIYFSIINQAIVLSFLQSDIQNNIFYLVAFAIGLDMMVSIYVGWRLLIHNDAHETTKRIFQIFELSLLIILLAQSLIDIHSESQLFYIVQGLFLALLMPPIFTVRWIAKFNVSEKWVLVFYIVIILVSLASFFWILEFGLYELNQRFSKFNSNFTLRIVFIFTTVYSFVLLLMNFFNLPTYSLFERKIQEIQLFSEADDSFQTLRREEDFLIKFFEKAIKFTKSDAGWVENTSGKIVDQHNLNQAILDEINQYIDYVGLTRNEDKILDRGQILNLEYDKFNSIMLVCVKSYKTQLAYAVFLKNYSKGFNFEDLRTVSSYARQVGLVIENSRSLKQFVENERMKDQVFLAKQVQRSLLPQKLNTDGLFEIAAISTAAREMGGDYYDFMAMGSGKFAVIIADVSGNGLSAAFGMAILKGVFRATIHESASASKFLHRANMTLSGCLDKKTFVTATVLIIDTHSKIINISCAGHCPVLYHFNHNIVPAHDHHGLGLAIARDERFSKFVVDEFLNYHKDGMLLLFTDGIIESHNSNSDEQFGTHRVYEFLFHNEHLSTEQFANELINASKKFASYDFADDDSTVVCIKF